MKKILSFLIAGALALGLIGCSGNMHDYEPIDPNAMKGNWFYRVLDVSKTTASNVNIIFNDGTNQTVDVTGVDTKAGSLAYIWAMSGVDKDTPTISTRTDCPDKSALGGDGKLIIYCFTNATKCNLYTWDGIDGSEYGDAWPGVAMETDAVIEVSEVNAAITFELVGGTAESNYWINGSFFEWKNGWPFETWGGKADCVKNSIYQAKSNASGTAVFGPYVVKLEANKEYSQEVKVVGYSDGPGDSNDDGTVTNTFKTGLNCDNGKYTIPSLTADSSVVITIDVSTGSAYNCSVKVSTAGMKIKGFMIDGLDSTLYPDNTILDFGGSFNGWAGKWNSKDDKDFTAEVSDGSVALSFATPIDITADKDNFEFLAVPVSADGGTWSNKIASTFCEDKGNGNAKIYNTNSGKSYYVYADVSGLTAPEAADTDATEGTVIAWKLVVAD